MKVEGTDTNRTVQSTVKGKVMSISDDVQRGIKQLRAIEDRFLNGSIDPVAARPTLQAIIEGKPTMPWISWTPAVVPSWYTSPEDQFNKAALFLSLHGGEKGFRPSDIPDVPDWRPHTSTEVLVLTVLLPDRGDSKGLQRSYDSWWDFGPSRDGVDGTVNSGNVRMAPSRGGNVYTPGIRWGAFDPYSYERMAPKDALALSRVNDTRVAGIEVLVAAAMFDQLPVAGMPNLLLSALQVYIPHGWEYTPRLSRNGDGNLQMEPVWAGTADQACASPTFRVL